MTPRDDVGLPEEFDRCSSVLARVGETMYLAAAAGADTAFAPMIAQASRTDERAARWRRRPR